MACERMGLQRRCFTCTLLHIALFFTFQCVHPPPLTTLTRDSHPFSRLEPLLRFDDKGICLDTVSERGVLLRRLDFGMLANSCAHTYCFTCVVTWAERTNTCPMCKERFNAVRRTPVQRLRGVRETVEVR